MVKKFGLEVAGPLEPFTDGFAGMLESEGYALGGARQLVLLLVHLSRWLEEQGLGAGDLTTELVTTLIEARDERTLLRLKGQLGILDLLVIDEPGYVPASKVGAELLFDVISTAYERTSLIVTSKLPFESWTEVLGSERLTGATLDRLTHRCRIIETKGESYRLQDAKSRTARVTTPRGATGSNGTATMPVDGALTTK